METRILPAILLFSLAVSGSTITSQDAVETPTSTIASTEAAVEVESQDLSNVAIERSSHAHIHTNPTFKGFWAKKFSWRPRWVKTWQEKKVYVAVWKHMWGPVVVKEWVPVPRPPPGWVKHDGGYVVKSPHYGK